MRTYRYLYENICIDYNARLIKAYFILKIFVQGNVGKRFKKKLKERFERKKKTTFKKTIT